MKVVSRRWVIKGALANAALPLAGCGGGAQSATADVGASDPPPPSPPTPPPPAAVPSGAYAYQADHLFQAAPSAAYASKIAGGSDFNADIWGPTRNYANFQTGLRWAHAGGDWIDANATAQGSVPFFSAALDSASGGALATFTYTINCTGVVQYAQANDKWLALALTTEGGARAMATCFHPTIARPSIAVNYTDATAATLLARVVAANTASSTGPVTTAEVVSLPAFIEFDRPTKAIASATLTLPITGHYSGNSTLNCFLLGPPVNAQTAGTGLAEIAAALDSGLAAVPGVIGSQRYADGSVLTDFVVLGAASKASEIYYDPALWGGTQDLTKWPHTVAGKFINTPASGLSLVDSNYRGEGFAPVAAGLGALRLHMPTPGVVDGQEVGNGGTLGADMLLMLPDVHFGTLARIFVRYYFRLGTPYARTPADRKHVLSAGAPRWTDMSGKWGITPSHATSYGGVSGTSGGGYGWQLRNAWYDCEAHTGGPLEGGIIPGFHVSDDYKANNPVGYRYGQPGDSGQWDGTHERWGAIGNLGGVLHAERWYCVEHELKLNDVAPFAANGELRCWIDGRLAFQETGMVFRTLPLYAPSFNPNRLRPARQLGIKELWLNWFHGGQSATTVDRTVFYSGLVYASQRIGPMRALP